MLLLLLLACPSTSPDDTGEALFPSCRTDADCTDGSTCFTPGECNVGDYEDPEDTCAFGSACEGGLVCDDHLATCDIGPWYECQESCEVRGCADNEQCDVVTGICSIWLCEDGYTCPLHTTCDPASDELNHCVRDRCEGDADCDGGHCVRGQCFAELGTCDWDHP